MIRRFEPGRAVGPDVLRRILHAATRAPSAGFTQAVEFLVLTTATDRGLFWLTQSGDSPAAAASAWLAGMRTAPALVVVTTSEQAYRERYAEPDKAARGGPDRSWTAPYWHVDAGMSTMLLLLAAVDEGLGACFFGLAGAESERRLAAEFDMPTERHCVGVIALGHPDAGAAPTGSPTKRARRTIEEQIHDGQW